MSAKPKHPGGRPPKISPEIREAFIAAVRAGNYLETAAASAGLAKDTLYRWLKAGARKEGRAYEEFSDAVQKAMADAETNDLQVIQRASGENWMAAAWRLERRFPQRWAKIEVQLQRLMKEYERGTTGNGTGDEATGVPGHRATVTTNGQ